MILLLVAFRTFRQATRPAAAIPADIHSPQPCAAMLEPAASSGRAAARALALSGTVAGLLSGLLGVGGGFVMVPALQRYTDLAMRLVVATSLAVIALVSVTGVVASAATGGIVWSVALPFSAGTLAGPQLQIGFAFVSAAVAVGMIVKSAF